MAQTDKTPEKPAVYVPAWTANPIVVVSKRMRNLNFPAVLLARDATAEELEAWRKGPTDIAAPRLPVFTLTLNAGVTFLGALTTQWKYLDVNNRQSAPRNPPNVDDCALLMPTSNANSQILNKDDPQFKARDAEGRPNHELTDPNRIAEMWVRVLGYYQAEEEAQLKAGAYVGAPLFRAMRGFDAPELTVGYLADFLASKGEAAREAYPYLAANVRGTRDGAHLGALHDYAVRAERGWDFVVKAREVLHMRPGLAR